MFQDNGRGMTEEVLRSYLKTGSTHSKIPKLDRDPSLPISLNAYINPALNRYGLGSNSVVGLGTRYEITSREYGSNETRIVTASYDEWEREEDGPGAYPANLTRTSVIDNDEDDNGEDWGLRQPSAAGPSSSAAAAVASEPPKIEFVLKHGTQIIIRGLYEQHLRELRDPTKRERLRSSLAQDYYLFLCGIPGDFTDPPNPTH